MKLNNIIKISTVDCQKIGGMLRVSATEVKMNAYFDFSSFEEIADIRKPAALSVEEKIEDGQRLFNTKLVFYICEDWIEDIKRKAFLCETIDGDRYLIGTEERPYPVVTRKTTHPNNYKDNQLTEVTVTYTSDKMLPIVV